MSTGIKAHTAICVLNGKMWEIDVPHQGYEPPELECLSSDLRFIYPGSFNFDGRNRDRLLPVLLNIASNITPGVTWYLAPRLKKCGGVSFGHHRATSPRDVVLLDCNQASKFLLLAAFHEAEHALEAVMTPDEIAAIDSAVNRGGEWNCDYMNDPVERRAELFGHAAMYVHGGGVLGMVANAPETAVFNAIMTGEIGRRRIHRQKVCTPSAAPKQPIPARVATWLGMDGFGRWLGTPAG